MSKWKWVAAGAGLVAGAALLTGDAKAEAEPEGYRVPDQFPTDDKRPFGPYHRTRRPPGWPLFTAIASDGSDTARGDGRDAAEAGRFARAGFIGRHGRVPSTIVSRELLPVSTRGAAIPAVRSLANDAGLGEPFVKTMANLAMREGEGGCFGVPARNFDARHLDMRHVVSGRRLATGFDGSMVAVLIADEACEILEVLDVAGIDGG